MSADDSPLGAVWRSGGVDFGLYAPDAAAVELCLFSSEDRTRETARVACEPGPSGSWRARVEGAGPGLLYGFRVDGVFDPASGAWFDRAKLLLDPRAGAITAGAGWGPPLLTANRDDSAAWAPRSVVVDPVFDWGDDSRPEVPWSRTIIYECHIGGMTRRHPQLPPETRGRYLGLAQPPVIEHLHGLGVTTLELMPVQHFVAERHLAATGRVNYWGYSPIGWLAPHADYATDDRGAQVVEFKRMVKELHRGGLEVIVDVVFNHTAEGGPDGLTLGPRAIDNAGFYRLDPDDRSRYLDYTGCGNTVDLRTPATRRLVLDALRYWAEEMHVDGFRFDLATVLGRNDNGFAATAPFFREIAADPLLSRLKLIAEPWDLGPEGCGEGRFPEGWREWNGRFRDDLRSFWRGDSTAARRVAARLTGSSDLYGSRASGQLTGVNFVACHDGFTLHDLVSYERKRNDANGEKGRDGTDHNLSRNWGVEGPTDDPSVRELRRRAKRNLLASLALSSGVPMLGHGDELGRTQQGNNNAYCHDSELTWIDWSLDAENRELMAFVGQALRLRRELGLFDRRSFFSPSELVWLRRDGQPMTADEWHRPDLRTLVALHRKESGRRHLMIFHAGETDAAVRPPDGEWKLRLTTATGVERRNGELRVAAYSLSAWTDLAAPSSESSSSPPEDPLP